VAFLGSSTIALKPSRKILRAASGDLLIVSDRFLIRYL
jgi:hypothetical protein